MNEHVHTKQCGFDRNASHSAGHYVCACGFEDESAKRFEAPSFSPPAPQQRLVPVEIDRKKHKHVLDVWNRSMEDMSSLDQTWPRLVEAISTPEPGTEYPCALSETTTNQRAACAEEGSGDSAKAKGPQVASPAPHGPQGSWAVNDPRRAFVDGAKWWEWTKSEATMWQHDIGLAEKEAEARFAPTDEPALLSEITTNQRAACREDGSAGSSKPNGSQDSPAAAHPDLTLSAAQVERYRTELHKLFQHHVGVDALCNMALKTLAPVEAERKGDRAVLDLLRQKMTSGNCVPVSVCVIKREELEALSFDMKPSKED